MITVLRQNLDSVPELKTPPSQPSMIQLLGGGGQAARRATDATAAFHRKAIFVVQYDAYWTAPEDAEKTIAWINNFRQLLAKYAIGAYVHYADKFLTNPLDQYYCANLGNTNISLAYPRLK